MHVGQQQNRRHPVAGEFEAKIIQDLTRDIAGRLNKEALLARTTDEFGRQDLAERAF